MCATFFWGVGALSKTPGPQATLTQWCRQFHCGLRRRWGDRFDLVSVALRWFGSPVSCVWVKNPSKYILKVVPPWVMFVGLLVYIPQYMTISILSIEFAEWILFQLKYGIPRIMMWRGIFCHSSAGSVTHNIKFVNMAVYYFFIWYGAAKKWFKWMNSFGMFCFFLELQAKPVKWPCFWILILNHVLRAHDFH